MNHSEKSRPWLPRPDFKAMLTAVTLPLLYYTVAVGGGLLLGYPGTACATPLFWLLAIFVGRDIPAKSRSRDRRARFAEAVLAGGLLGLLQGALFTLALILFIRGPEDTTLSLIGLGVAVTASGIVVCAGVSLAFTALWERQRRAKEQPLDSETGGVNGSGV